MASGDWKTQALPRGPVGMPKYLDAPKGSGRKDIKNSFMFNSKGVGAGTWVGDGTVTRTKASSTLFVTAVPNSISIGRVEELFEKEPGFFAFLTLA